MHGHNKAFIELQGRPLIHWVIEKLRDQVDQIFIAGYAADDARYRSLGLELLADTLTPNYGPLAGVLAGLERTDTPYVFTAPCDTPFLPATLVARLYQRLQDSGVRAVSVRAGTRQHGTLSLLERGLAGDLRAYLLSGGRQVRAWLASVGAQDLDFSLPGDAFLNINSNDDIKRAEAMLRTAD